MTDTVRYYQSSILRKHFSEAELHDLEERLAKHLQERASVWGLPILFASGDISYNSWFPDEVRVLGWPPKFGVTNHLLESRSLVS